MTGERRDDDEAARETGADALPEGQQPTAPPAEVMPATAITRSVNMPADIAHERAELGMIVSYGRMMAQSGFFPDTKSEAQAMVKILAGRSLGFGPIESMTGFHIIDGKVVTSAHIMAHAVKRSPKYDYHVNAHDELRCEIEFFEKSERTGGWQSLGLSIFTREDAEQAGLGVPTQKYEWTGPQGNRQKHAVPGQVELTNYQKYPRNMMFARAMSNGIAWHCPDVFETRVYLPDEIRPDLVLTEGGEIRDIEAIVVEPRQPERNQPPPAQPTGGRDDGRRDGNRSGQQQRQTPPPAQSQQPATPPGGARASANDPIEIDAVHDLQTLQRFQWSRWRKSQDEVCRQLDIERISDITVKFTTPEQYREAAGLLWSAFDPEGYAQHIEDEAARIESGPPNESSDATTDDEEIERVPLEGTVIDGNATHAADAP